MSETDDTTNGTETIPVYAVERGRRRRTETRLATREHGWPTHAPSKTGYETWVETMQELEDAIDLEAIGPGDRVATMTIDAYTREVIDYTLTVGVTDGDE